MVPYMDGGAQESGLRAGTVNVAAVIGMAVALKKSCEAQRIASSSVSRSGLAKAMPCFFMILSAKEISLNSRIS